MIKSVVNLSTEHFNACVSVNDLSSRYYELSIREYFVEVADRGNLSIGYATDVVNQDFSPLGLVLHLPCCYVLV